MSSVEKQIWFERWGWSYVPIHWKGWAVLFAMVAATLLAYLALRVAFIAFGIPFADDLAFILGVVSGCVALLGITRKHI